MLKTCLFLLCTLNCLYVAAAPAEPSSADLEAMLENDLVQVQALRGGKLVALSTGVVVAPDLLLVNAQRLDRARQVRVRHPGTGVESEAEVIYSNPHSGIAFLRASDLPAPQLQLALDGLSASQLVRTPAPRAQSHGYELVEGYVSRSDERSGESADEPSYELLQHNALISANEYGAPLLNECNQVVAFNRPDPEFTRLKLRRAPDPEGVVFAVGAAAVAEALVANGQPVRQAEEACQSQLAGARERAQQSQEEAKQAKAAAEQARSAADAAEARAREARQQAEDLAKKADASAAEKAEAEQRALAAREAAEAARDEALEREAEALEEQERAERSRVLAEEAQAENRLLKLQQHWLAVALAASGVVLLLVICLAIWRGRRKRALIEQSRQQAEQAEAALAQAVQPAAFACLLAGYGPGQQPVTLKISAQQLGVRRGVVVGRHPDRAAVVLDHESVSRAHFRLLASGRELFVEDLDSGNGTAVNDRELQPGALLALRDGDSLQVAGTFTFTVSLVEGTADEEQAGR